MQLFCNKSKSSHVFFGVYVYENLVVEDTAQTGGYKQYSSIPIVFHVICQTIRYNVLNSMLMCTVRVCARVCVCVCVCVCVVVVVQCT